jgi:hypothetical protein
MHRVTVLQLFPVLRTPVECCDLCEFDVDSPTLQNASLPLIAAPQMSPNVPIEQCLGNLDSYAF